MQGDPQDFSELREGSARPPRPLAVWLISGFFGLASLANLVSLLSIATGMADLDELQRQYFDSLSTADYAISIATALLSLGGAVALFLLRKQALQLLAASLVLGSAYTLWTAFTSNWAVAAGRAGLAGGVVGYALLAAVCAYAWFLSRRGVLG